jgi:hypothetical protein
MSKSTCTKEIARLSHRVFIWHAEILQPNSPKDLYWEGPEEDSEPLNPPATVCEKILKRRVVAFVFIAGHGRGCRVCEDAMWLLVKENSCTGPFIHMMRRNLLTLRVSSPGKTCCHGSCARLQAQQKPLPG